jgi:hypothetical protein
MRRTGSAYSLILAFVSFGCSRDCSLSAGKTKHEPPLLLAGAGKGATGRRQTSAGRSRGDHACHRTTSEGILETHPDAPWEAELPFEIEGMPTLRASKSTTTSPVGRFVRGGGTGA